MQRQPGWSSWPNVPREGRGPSLEPMALATHKILQGSPGLQTDGLKNHSSPHSGKHLPFDLLTSSSPLLLLLSSSSSSSSTFCHVPGDPGIPGNQTQEPMGVDPPANAQRWLLKQQGGLGAQPCTTPSLRSPLFNWRGPRTAPKKLWWEGVTQGLGACVPIPGGPPPQSQPHGRRGDDKHPSCGSMRWEAC